MTGQQFRDRWMRLTRRFRHPSDPEVDAELASITALLVEERIASGMTTDEARRAAKLELGGDVQIREEVREARPWAPMDRLTQDVRFGLRMFRRAPALNLAVVVTLALGIGATAATFAVVDVVLLRPLAYADADRLVVLLHRGANPVAPANFLDWQRDAREFASMGAAEYWTPVVGVSQAVEKLTALHVSDDILPMLGVPPALGRFPVLGSERREVIIADGLWHRLFGGDPAVLGRDILLDGAPHAVVGVMPAGFAFAPFWATRAELWAPLDLRPRATDRGGNSLRVFARLASGATLEQARASIEALTRAMDARYPGTNRNVIVTPLKDKVVGDVRGAILMLFGAVGLVLLIACTNVAHMLLARATSREREIAVRVALGAGRPRMMRQLLTESVILAIAGGAAGLLLARVAVSLIRELGAASIPRVQSLALDGRLLAFTAALSVLTVLVFGLAPALRMSRPTLTTALRDGDRSATAGRRSRRIRRILVASEVALAITLLVGAALLVRSFAVIRSVDPGWVPDRLVTMVVTVTGSAEAAPGRRPDFYQSVIERLRRLPGVEDASAINHAPLVGDVWGYSFFVEGRPIPAPGDEPGATYRVVLPRYFQTVQLPLDAGRDFNDVDRAGAPPVAIVNRYLAETYWPGESAMGKRIRIGGRNAEWTTVVGVVKNAVRSNWQEPAREELYVPVLQSPTYLGGAGPHVGYITCVIRTSGDPSLLVPSLTRVVRELAPSVPVSSVTLMSDAVDSATVGARFIVMWLTTFAVVALLLAAVGIYGVMSHAVANRRQEIGIRLALGASRGQIMWRIVGEGLAVASAGALAGFVAAVALGNAISGLLFGVTPHDLPAFAIAAGTLIATAAIACYLPARRAGRVDPLSELR